MTGQPCDNIVIDVVRHDDDLRAVATLFREYRQWLDQSVCFENFEEELATLPGSYSPPAGELWLARRNGEPIGVVGVLRYDGDRAENACEMKRLYVCDSARGLGLGRELAVRCLKWARNAGYDLVALETFETLDAAWSLYISLGFVESAGVHDKPLNAPVFLTCHVEDRAG